MNLSIIIPNFNGKKLLEKNLPRVLNEAKDAEIIVVDDASTDESVSYVKKNFPEIKLISKEKNEGFASTVNLGVSHVSRDFIFLLNSDCYPEKGSIEKIMKLFEDSRLFAAGFAQKSHEGGKVITRGRGLGRFEIGFFKHSYGSPDKISTQWVSGGAGIFRKSIWMKLGGLDPIFNPFYWEDIDLSYRALKAGFTILFEPSAYVVHEQTEGSIRSHYSPREVEAISYRNQILFVWMNISNSSFLLSHIIHLFYNAIKSFVMLNIPYLQGYLMAKQRFISAMSRRMKRRKLWKKRDIECIIHA